MPKLDRGQVAVVDAGQLDYGAVDGKGPRDRQGSVLNSELVRPIAKAQMQSEYLLQSSAWAGIKSKFGWQAFAFRQERFPHLSSNILVLVRRVARLGHFAYIPDGLLCNKALAVESAEDRAHVAALCVDAFVLIEAIGKFLQTSTMPRLFAIRWDMPWVCIKPNQPVANKAANTCFEKLQQKIQSTKTQYCTGQHTVSYTLYRRESVQPPASVLLDLSLDEATLLASMKSKTRYNTKLGKKKGLQISSTLHIDEFYKLYSITSQRNVIAIHSKEYYQQVRDELANNSTSEVHIYGAIFEEKLLASIMVIHFTATKGLKTAIYLYGASSDEHRNLMPSHALQWHAICQAKQNGCQVYDMFGIPAMSTTEPNKVHRMQGLYQFKTGFGGIEMQRAGTYDLVSNTSRTLFGKASCRLFSKLPKTQLFNKLRYRIFILAEQVRHWYYYQYKKH